MIKRIFKMEIKMDNGKRRTIFFPVAVYDDKEDIMGTSYKKRDVVKKAAKFVKKSYMKN